MKLLTERLKIHEPREKDAHDVFIQKTDKESNIYTGGITELSWFNFEKKYKESCNNLAQYHTYSVILRSNDSYIGYCGFQYCDILKDIEILYGFHSKYWGNSYGYEAAKAVLSYGFNSLDLENIVAAVNPKNIGSEKILQKLGFVFDSYIEWPEQGTVNKYILTKENYKRISN